MSNSYLRTSYHNCNNQYMQKKQSTTDIQQGGYGNANANAFSTTGGLPFPATQAGGYLSNTQSNNTNAYANNGYYGQTLADVPIPEHNYYRSNQTTMPYPNAPYVPNPYGGGGGYLQQGGGNAYGGGGYLQQGGGTTYGGGGYLQQGGGTAYGGGGYLQQEGGNAYGGTGQANQYLTSQGGMTTGTGVVPHFEFPQEYLPPVKEEVPPPAPKCIPKAYGANESAGFWGDPHIVDADRADKKNDKATSFDVTDAGLYNILEDKGVQFNAKFEKFPQWGPTVATEAGINLNGAKVLVSADGTTTVNGKKLVDGETVTLKDGSKITDAGKGVKISTNAASGEYDIEITSVDSGQKKPDGTQLFYIDSKVSTREKGVGSDAVAPKGILGEGFDDDNVERKALKLGSADKYKADKLITDNPEPLPLPMPPIQLPYPNNYIPNTGGLNNKPVLPPLR